MNRGYQNDFSSLHGDSMYDTTARERKAGTMLKVLNDYYRGESIIRMSLLDVGASTGIIDEYLSRSFAQVTGVDIDAKAIGYAERKFVRENLRFLTGDAMSLCFPDTSFDVVICSQVYEHVPDATKMIDEIFRVLKPGGICYFAAGNRLAIEEHHHHLPFLSAIPRPLGHLYLRMAGKGSYYYEKHMSYWGLKKLVAEFEVEDYTGKVIKDPGKFGARYMLEPGSKKHKLAQIIVNRFYWLCPGYIWVLRKPPSG